MLTEVEKREIEQAVAIVPRRDSAGIDALRIVQRHRRWIDDDTLHDIADHLGMSPAELDSLATFYNLIHRRPVGRHVIYMCDSVSCWIMGCDRVRAQLSERLGIGFGETTEDQRFTLLPIQCLGVCEHAPALMVGEDLHWDLQPDRVDDVLEGYD